MRKAEIKFLNVDLEIESAEDLRPLVDELAASGASVHFHGVRGDGLNFASFGGSLPLAYAADAVTEDFCRLIEDLSPEAKAVWHGCAAKRFDAGFESGDAPPSFQMELSRETIERIAALGASLVVTIYPPGD